MIVIFCPFTPGLTMAFPTSVPNSSIPMEWRPALMAVFFVMPLHFLILNGQRLENKIMVETGSNPWNCVPRHPKVPCHQVTKVTHSLEVHNSSRHPKVPCHQVTSNHFGHRRQGWVASHCQVEIKWFIIQSWSAWLDVGTPTRPRHTHNHHHSQATGRIQQ